MANPKKILLIEDVDPKADDILGVLNEFFSTKRAEVVTTLASSMVEAEDFLETSDWDLVLLDITMNITEATSSNIDGNQADLGGLELAETMYLTRREFPTISITGFDYFKASDVQTSENSFLYLDELRNRLHHFLGDSLFGTVRYGNASWKHEFSEMLDSWWTSMFPQTQD